MRELTAAVLSLVEGRVRELAARGLGRQVAIAVLILCAAPLAAQESGPVNALVLTSTADKIAAPLEEYLRGEGFQLVSRPLAEPVSQDILRQFHLVIITDFYGQQMPLFHDPSPGGFISQYYTLQRNLDELRAYVEAGGGLFFSPAMEGGGLAVAEALQPLLGPWGVEVYAANARDDAHTWRNYAWTENIAPSPVTEGVRRLFYPIEMGRWDDAYPTTPFALHDPRWQPVVRGMPGSTVSRCLQYTTWFAVPGAQNPPVLAAIAQIGHGRAALLAINRFFTFVYPYEEVAGGNIGEFHTGPIGGVVLEKGDGERASDGRLLIRNLLRWVAESAVGQGMGTYTPKTYAALRPPAPAEVPTWLTGWWEGNGGRFHRVLIGARSAASRGKGSIAQWAAAARENGYAILVMTEDLDSFDPGRWADYVSECRNASGPDLVVLPGLDMNDAYGNRLLLYGQTAFPQPWMLTADGKAMQSIQYLMLGFGMSCSAIAHPTSSPLPHHLFKFFSGLVVYTYDQDGNLIDDGTQAYQAQIYNQSNPMPLVVHELYEPGQVQLAARKGHQLSVLADTVQNAAWYLRDGMSHFWEVPVKLLVSSGPVLRTLTPGAFVLESEQPIAEVRYITHYGLLRRWTPHATRFEGAVALDASRLHMGFLWARDADGGTLISPPLRAGNSAGYNWRCSDRQNFFAVAVNYTGTLLSDGVDIWLPTFGTDEGKGLWPRQFGPQRGENMAPLLEFPYFSPVVTVTDAILDQRYWRALWEDVVFDAKPPQGTSRSRVYDGRVRYFDLHYRTYGQRGNEIIPLMLMQVDLRLRQPVTPSGDVFPGFVNVGAQPTCWVKDQAGQWVSHQVDSGWLELPVGGSANDLMALTPGLRVNASGMVGFAPPPDTGPLPSGHSWSARWVRLDPTVDMALWRAVLGVAGPTPWKLNLTRGSLISPQYVASYAAEGYGIAGEVVPYPAMPMKLKLRVAGVNWNWQAGVWQPEASPDITPVGVFEGEAWADLDATRGGPIYVGNLVMADDTRLRLGILAWDADRIRVDVNNPTDEVIQAQIWTPEEIVGRYLLRQEITMEPGTSQVLEGRRAP